MKRLILSAITAALVIVPATAASATESVEDPCPGEHVTVWKETKKGYAHNNDGRFVCQSDVQGPQGEQGPVGPEGPAGPQGVPGFDGKDGRDGVDGVNGIDGQHGWQGPAGQDGVDSTSTEELRALITELNNRLFILEHTDPVVTPTLTCEMLNASFGTIKGFEYLDADGDGVSCERDAEQPVAETPVSHGELPKTGSNTPYLVALGSIMLLAGIATRMAFARR